MKKIFASALVFLYALTIAPVAFAASGTDVMPKGLMGIIQLDLSKSPFASEVKSYLSKNLSSEFGTPDEQVAATLKSLISNNSVSIGINEKDASTFVAIQASDADWETVETSLKADKEFMLVTYNNRSFYKNTADYRQNSVGFINGFLVIASGNMETVIDGSINGLNMSTDPSYAQYSALNLNDAVLKVYFDMANSSLRSNMGFMNEMGFSVAKTSTGAAVQFSYDKRGGSDEMTQIFAASDNPFVPSMYKYAPAKNPMFYSEASALNLKSLVDVMNTYSLTGSEKLNFNEQFFKGTGLNLNTEILDLLSGSYSITAENSSKLVPNVTLLFNASTKTATAKDTLSKIADKIGSKTISDEFVFSVNRTATPDQYLLNVKLTQKGLVSIRNDKDTWMLQDSFPMDIYFGLKGDGNLYFTNDQDFSTKYGTGLDVSKFGNQIGKATITSIASTDITQIKDYAKRLISMPYQNLTNEEKQYVDSPDEQINEIEKMMAPWKTAYAWVNKEGTRSDMYMYVDFDSSVYSADYWKNAFGSKSKKTSFDYSRVKHEFADSNRTTWYYPYVKKMYVRGYVNGYPDNTFKAEKPVTRAEFLKMIEGVMNIKTSYYQYSYAKEFSDVQPGDWYYPYVNAGLDNYLISGSGDTFNPNKPITRAEAVKILSNAMYDEDPKAEYTGFRDVSEDDWFYDYVKKAYEAQMVTGAGNGMFLPNKSLTRAEAVKLMSNLSVQY